MKLKAIIPLILIGLLLLSVFVFSNIQKKDNSIEDSSASTNNIPIEIESCTDIDINSDLKFTLVDLISIIDDYKTFCGGTSNTSACGSKDTNNDGYIDLMDILYMLDKWKISDYTKEKLNPDSEVVTGVEVKIAGLNMGDGFSSDYYEYMNDLNMKYSIALYVNPNEASKAVTFVKESNSNDLLPILRLCYVGGCDFKSKESIENFYKEISAGLEIEEEFIAILGPNENQVLVILQKCQDL
ncbi:MAG: hypothetical protein Q9M91_07940 [Candidatus Dojkabacteria bacterium]|nr:hypothetical protein [Candidatus Dojkabacteria bacterium]